MKRARRHNRIFTSSIATGMLLGIFYGVVKYMHILIAAAPITVVYDPTFSDVYRTQLNHDLVDAIHTKGPAVVVADPAAYSPFLSTLSVRYTFPYHGLLTYKTIEPCAVLNHTVAALATGDIVPSDMLSADSLAALPSLQVPCALLTHTQVPELLKLFLKDISPMRGERFVCEWVDADICYYRDTKQPQYTLISHGQTPLNDNDIKLYDAVLQQFKPERNAKKWVVDIRFNGQVVINPDGGL